MSITDRPASTQPTPPALHLEAKRPRTIAAGPYGHPVHPALVTIPIGAWVTSLVFDIASRHAGEPEVFVKGSFWLIGVGIVGAVVAALFGFLDLLAIPHHPAEGERRHTRAFIVAVVHMDLNFVALGLHVAGFLIRRGDLNEPPVAWLPIGLSVTALVFLAAAGWLGGMLAYRYGVRVAAEDTQLEGFS